MFVVSFAMTFSEAELDKWTNVCLELEYAYLLLDMAF